LIINIGGLKSGDIINGGIFYLHSYYRKSYNDGKKHFITGTFRNKQHSIGVKMWDNSSVEKFSNTDMSGGVFKVSGEVKDYKGDLDIHVQSIERCTTVSEKSFLKSVDIEGVFAKFATFIGENISEKGETVLSAFFGAEGIYDSFKHEFAGTKMHDAQVGGLMSHTLKMLHIAKTLVNNDDRLKQHSDLLYMGIILHDVGKVHEYKVGVQTPRGFVTHRIFGIEMLSRYKTDIVKLYDEDFYYHLLAIIQGHHGPYGEPPKTVWALVIHYIDMLESFCTGTLDRIDSGDAGSGSAGQKTVSHDGKSLVF